jgi:hypothetical protein
MGHIVGSLRPGEYLVSCKLGALVAALERVLTATSDAER